MAMSRESRISRVYAEALLELAAERDRLEPVAEGARLLSELFRRDRDSRVFLESPSVDFASKERVFETALRGRIADEVLDFLLVVLRRGRQHALGRILEEFEALYKKKIGVVEARTVTAVAVAPEVLEELRRALERALGARVILESAVDEEILGGFIVRFDGMVLDGSLRRDLSELRDAMRTVEFGTELVHENSP